MKKSKIPKYLLLLSGLLSLLACGRPPEQGENVGIGVRISPPPLVREDASLFEGMDNIFNDIVGLMAPVRIRSTSNQFSCYAVNITGDGIANTTSSLVATASAALGSHCRSLGLVSKTIGSGGGVLDVTVPKGGTKQIQVLGIHSNGGCGSGGSFADDFASQGTGVFREVSEIGYTSVSVDTDTSVTIDTSYDPANAKNLIECDAGANLASINGSLKMWYRADFFHGIATDGSQYGAAINWTDRAQSSFSMGNNGTNLPVYYKTGGPNGQAALDLAGAEHTLRSYGSGPFPLALDLTGMTVVAVAKHVGTGGVLFGYSTGADFNTGNDFMYIGEHNGSQWTAKVNKAGPLTYSANVSTSNANWNIHIGIFDGSPTNYLYYYVGGLSGSSATTAIDLDLAINGAYGFIGKYELPPSAPDYLNGRIAEVIVFDKALSSSELSILKQYLYKRYRLSVTTP